MKILLLLSLLVCVALANSSSSSSSDSGYDYGDVDDENDFAMGKYFWENLPTDAIVEVPKTGWVETVQWTSIWGVVLGGIACISTGLQWILLITMWVFILQRTNVRSFRVWTLWPTNRVERGKQLVASGRGDNAVTYENDENFGL